MKAGFNYTYIVNPKTGRKVKTNGKLGRKILNMYVTFLTGGLGPRAREAARRSGVRRARAAPPGIDDLQARFDALIGDDGLSVATVEVPSSQSSFPGRTVSQAAEESYINRLMRRYNPVDIELVNSTAEDEGVSGGDGGFASVTPSEWRDRWASITRATYANESGDVPTAPTRVTLAPSEGMPGSGSGYRPDSDDEFVLTAPTRVTLPPSEGMPGSGSVHRPDSDDELGDISSPSKYNCSEAGITHLNENAQDLRDTGDEDICAICHEALSTQSSLGMEDEPASQSKTTGLPNCTHRFHLSCITMWAKTKCICPLCRKSMEP